MLPSAVNPAESQMEEGLKEEGSDCGSVEVKFQYLPSGSGQSYENLRAVVHFG